MHSFAQLYNHISFKQLLELLGISEFAKFAIFSEMLLNIHTHIAKIIKKFDKNLRLQSCAKECIL